MLYDKSRTKALDEKIFENPPKEYRGAPFWAWNTKLKEEELLWQIDRLKEMGFGGYFMHVRSGMNTEYMGKDFMKLIRACVEHGKTHEMLSYLYDEDRWASGAAGGFVTENKKFRARKLYLTTDSVEKVTAEFGKADRDPKFITSFDLVLDANGYIKSYSFDPSSKKGTRWNVFRVLDEPSGWFNGYTYPDMMNPEAIDKFIEVTHEAYAREVGEDFGKSVPAIFTDEPNYGIVGNARFAHGTTPIFLVWTDNFPDSFRATYGYDVLEKLPEIIWDKANEPSTVRYHYFDHACERFVSAFTRKVGKWCDEHGIALTGHVLLEESLGLQSNAVGETMRHYGAMAIPGIDILVNKIELSTAKQCQSAVHQYGREGMLSELYGVTGWAFDFRGHKFQGDWQAALGVTLRVPHLSWVSMKGSAKRDYPASIHYQSSWYKEYPLIEDHFARLNTVLTRGTPRVRVALLHTVESHWLNAGALDTSTNSRTRLDTQFNDVINWLLRGNIDFDFIAESTIPELYKSGDKGFTMGAMTYDAVLVPPVDTLRSTTVAALDEFVSKGGKLVTCSNAPACVDGALSKKAQPLYEKSQNIPFSSADILGALEDVRDVTVYRDNGDLSRMYVYNMRQDGDRRWLFLARCEELKRKNSSELLPVNLEIKVVGAFKPTLYDTISGTKKAVPFIAKDGITRIKCSISAHDSLLFALDPIKGDAELLPPPESAREYELIRFFDHAEYELDEPNVMVLDMCEYSLDGKEWQPIEEISRIDDKFRKQWNWPKADGHDVQPWKIVETAPDTFPYLRFKFTSEVAADCSLAFEEATEVVFNGKQKEIKKVGWYVDKDILVMPLGKIVKGENTLVIRAPISKRVSLENYFILGDFGVRVEGAKAVVTERAKKLPFGSVVNAGLPFYGGKITYKVEFESQGGDAEISTDFFAGALVSVALDGKTVGKIAFAPFTLALNGLSKGKHELALTLYATRVNTFGALHDSTDVSWKGPGAWYVNGQAWAYEYMLNPVGLIKSPQIKLYK